MTVTTKIRIICAIILLFNLWLIGKYNISGITTLILTVGLVCFVEYFIIRNIPLEKLSKKELNRKLKRKTKIMIIKDIQSIQNCSKNIKYCYIIAAGLIYIPLFVSGSFTTELFPSLSLLLFGTLILGAIFHAILFLYIYFKYHNKVKNSYQHYLDFNKNKEMLINTIRTIDTKNKV
ncbi:MULTISPECIES: hypothetical protein [Acinetobacter]|uniref:Uncharacterized protein n=1 Tax=Acinetobacter higginsii TaxID=70347 RepID=N9T1V3_9GAMM|nr:MULTISPECIES: hypothetical protein [Acinetobacter]ENX57662.1 hypothetical protein F902_02059 [Acinetobacter higginsii]